MALDSELLARIDERTINIAEMVTELKGDRELLHKRISETTALITGKDGLEHRLTSVEADMHGTTRWLKILTGAIVTAVGGLLSMLGWKQ